MAVIAFIPEGYLNFLRSPFLTVCRNIPASQGEEGKCRKAGSAVMKATEDHIGWVSDFGKVEECFTHLILLEQRSQQPIFRA